MKDKHSAFRSYLNKDKVYFFQASLGLVDARIIGVFVQSDPNLTFHNDLKQAIVEVMSDGTPVSIFPKRVKDPSKNASNIRFTNGLAV
jgi:hypothetical protein